VAPKPVRAEPPRPKAPPAPPPAYVGFEVVDETELAAPATDATAPARSKSVRAARDEDDDDQPRRKKPKKPQRAKTADEEAEDYHARRLKEFEYTWPAVLLVLGMVMSFAGALGYSGASGFMTIGVMMVGMFITIPLTILVLMVVGTVVGINYGRFGPAVLKIAAVSFIVNGVYFIGAWFKLPIFVVSPIGCAVAFGLFKTLFDLDNSETNTSMGALNVISFAAKVIIIGFLTVAEARQDRDFDPDDDGDDPVPTDTRRHRGKNKPPPTPAPTNPDGEPDEPDDPDDS
jgi:hypothetical protein